jgi:Leucine-rich repeat (LRR) protein
MCYRAGVLGKLCSLEVLDLSYNVLYMWLSCYRAGVLGNLSSLEVLDLSYNVLQDEKLRADRWGGLLQNLTYLNLAHNQLYNIPAKHLAQVSLQN